MDKWHESSSKNLAEFYSLTSLCAYNFNQIALDFIGFNFTLKVSPKMFLKKIFHKCIFSDAYVLMDLYLSGFV